jgi:hypothetical protein
VLGLFTADATYRSHPLHPAHTGHQGIADYWTRATAVQREVRVRVGHPIVDGDRVAAEWWTVMRADGTPVTLGNPGGGDPARGHARRWAEGYEAAWWAGDPEAAAALYAPDAHYRSEPFRALHLGREGVLTYTRDAYATEADQDPRFGAPFASGASAAVEWWTTTLEEASRPPSSAPRSSPSPPTAWSPPGATTGSWNPASTPHMTNGAADLHPRSHDAARRPGDRLGNPGDADQAEQHRQQAAAPVDRDRSPRPRTRPVVAAHPTARPAVAVPPPPAPGRRAPDHQRTPVGAAIGCSAIRGPARDGSGGAAGSLMSAT